MKEQLDKVGVVVCSINFPYGYSNNVGILLVPEDEENVNEVTERLNMVKMHLKNKQLQFAINNPSDKELLKLLKRRKDQISVLSSFSAFTEKHIDYSGCRSKEYAIDSNYFTIKRVSEKNIERCSHCGIEVYKKKMISMPMCNTPWDEPIMEKFCSMFCYECKIGSIYSKDFRYFTCCECERVICEQNPRNGYHIQYRGVGDEQICLKCYQENLLENGADINRLKKGTIQGMFFSSKDRDSAGYTAGESFFVNNESKVSKLIEYCENLVKSGNKFIIDFDSLAIGGGEGNVTVYYKKDENKQKNYLPESTRDIVKGSEITAYSDALIEKLVAKELRFGEGDCLYCQTMTGMYSNSKFPEDYSCLVTHIREKYYMGRVIYNAMAHLKLLRSIEDPVRMAFIYKYLIGDELFYEGMTDFEISVIKKKLKNADAIIKQLKGNVKNYIIHVFAESKIKMDLKK